MPTLSRPLFNPLLGQETAVFVALETAFAGTIDVSSSTRFGGFEAALARSLWDEDGWRLSATAGFRYLNLTEKLTISQNTTILPRGILGFDGPFIFAPNGVRLLDRFDTRNTFAGAQVGVESGWAWDRLRVEGSAKVSVGNTRRVIDVAGTSELLDGQGRVVGRTAGGVLAQATNSGRREEDCISVVPELEGRLSYAVTDRLTASVGYSLLYWPGVARPGDRIDRTVDPRQLPTSLQFTPGAAVTRPGVVGGGSDFWAQGLNVGVTLKF